MPTRHPGSSAFPPGSACGCCRAAAATTTCPPPRPTAAPRRPRRAAAVRARGRSSAVCRRPVPPACCRCRAAAGWPGRSVTGCSYRTGPGPAASTSSARRRVWTGRQILPVLPRSNVASTSYDFDLPAARLPTAQLKPLFEPFGRSLCGNLRAALNVLDRQAVESDDQKPDSAALLAPFVLYRGGKFRFFRTVVDRDALGQLCGQLDACRRRVNGLSPLAASRPLVIRAGGEGKDHHGRERCREQRSRDDRRATRTHVRPWIPLDRA